VIRVNARQRQRMVDKIEAAVGGDLSGRTVAVLGLSFKPETDDMRDAPSVDIVRGLLERGAAVRAFDPVAMAPAAKLLPEVTFAKDAYHACEGAEVVVIVTEWNQFRMLDLERIRSRLQRPLVVDLRNIYRPEQMHAAGFEYVSVGR
jgi:UDPglucose 6-dehydrogenase